MPRVMGNQSRAVSALLLSAGSRLTELHKGAFHALHKQARGMKGCYRKASTLPAAKARVPKITACYKPTERNVKGQALSIPYMG